MSLSDELHAFLIENSGDGTLFCTPGEFVRDLIRKQKEKLDGAALRESVLQGYADIRAGRTMAYTGDLRVLLEAYRSRRPIEEN